MLSCVHGQPFCHWRPNLSFVLLIGVKIYTAFALYFPGTLVAQRAAAAVSSYQRRQGIVNFSWPRQHPLAGYSDLPLSTSLQPWSNCSCQLNCGLCCLDASSSIANRWVFGQTMNFPRAWLLKLVRIPRNSRCRQVEQLGGSRFPQATGSSIPNSSFPDAIDFRYSCWVGLTHICEWRSFGSSRSRLLHSHAKIVLTILQTNILGKLRRGHLPKILNRWIPSI